MAASVELVEPKQFILESFHRNKTQQLIELRQENEFCDLILKSDDGFEIKVHRVVVASASNYFKDLLTLPLKEKFEECISLPGITADVLEKIITFIYTSEFDVEEIEDIEKIIKYAAIFQLEELVEICLLTLNKSINDHTCVKYWRLARNNLIYSLKDKCLAYIFSNVNHLFESSLMSDLTIEEMRFFLADNRLHLKCDEKKIFENVWKWAEDNVSETKSFSQIFSEVVELLHFSKLENDFVFQKIFDNEDILTNAELLKKVSELTKKKNEDAVPSRFIFHQATQRNRLFGLLSKKMFIGLGEENTIEKEVNLPRNFGYATFDNKLLICGGLDGKKSITNSCEFFEPSTQQWKKLPSMKKRKSWHSCSNFSNKIYACGGVEKNIIEIFDLGKGEWNYGPEMLSNNFAFGLTGVNGALYAIGGQTNNVEILDPRTQKWNVVYSDSRFNTCYLRCVSIGACIYCFTGINRYIFDTRSNNITEKMLCMDFSNFFNFCELGDYINGLGGYTDNSGDKYSLNLVQYHLDGKVGFKKSYGLYNEDAAEISEPAIVSMYY